MDLFAGSEKLAQVLNQYPYRSQVMRMPRV